MWIQQEKMIQGSDDSLGYQKFLHLLEVQYLYTMQQAVKSNLYGLCHYDT